MGRDDRAAAPGTAAGPAGGAVVGGAAVRRAPGARGTSGRPSRGRAARVIPRDAGGDHPSQGRPAGSGSSTGTVPTGGRPRPAVPRSPAGRRGRQRPGHRRHLRHRHIGVGAGEAGEQPVLPGRAVHPVGVQAQHGRRERGARQVVRGVAGPRRGQGGERRMGAVEDQPGQRQSSARRRSTK